MQTVTSSTWSWPSADPALVDALRDGALEGLRSVPESAGTVVFAEFFGRTVTLTEFQCDGSDFGGCFPSGERRERETDPEPALRVVLRAPEGERTVVVSLAPEALGADTPEEAREYAADCVRAVLSDRPAQDDGADPDALASGFGMEDMYDLAHIRTAEKGPLMTRAALVAGVRELYGPSAEAHERGGRPSGRELADSLRTLAREAKRAGHDFPALVVESVPAVQAGRLARLLVRALDAQEADHALQSLAPAE